MSFLMGLWGLWQRFSWRMWGRRAAIRQVRKLIANGPLGRPDPHYPVEFTRKSNTDDAGLN